MTAKELKEIVEYQESVLQFDCFGREEALQLGTRIIDTARAYGFSVAVSVVLNELEVFRYFFEGTTMNNEIWMEAKRNTMRATGHSSLHFVYSLAESGMRQEDLYMPKEEYAASGGGFPIYVKGTGVVGYACVSNTPHETDHKILTESMAAMLGLELEHPLPIDTGY